MQDNRDQKSDGSPKPGRSRDDTGPVKNGAAAVGLPAGGGQAMGTGPGGKGEREAVSPSSRIDALRLRLSESVRQVRSLEPRMAALSRDVANGRAETESLKTLLAARELELTRLTSAHGEALSIVTRVQSELSGEKRLHADLQKLHTKVRSDLAVARADAVEAGRTSAAMAETAADKMKRGVLGLPIRIGRGRLDKRPRDTRSDLRTVITASGFFEREWYLANYPDVADAGADPANHYFVHGGLEGRDPGPNFSSRWYIARHPDVGSSRMNPLVHFIAFGRMEGRLVAPSRLADDAEYAGETQTAAFAPGMGIRREATDEDIDLLRSSPYFDEIWYVEQYPEYASTGLDPVRHYLRFGFQDNLHPGPKFDGPAYVARHADVAAERLNPLLHFIRFGRSEGRWFKKVDLSGLGLPIPRTESTDEIRPADFVEEQVISEDVDEDQSTEQAAGATRAFSESDGFEPLSFRRRKKSVPALVARSSLTRTPGQEVVEIQDLILGTTRGKDGAQIIAKVLPTMQAFATMMGFDPLADLGIFDGNTAHPHPEISKQPCNLLGDGHSLQTRATDFWFTSDFDLRVRFVGDVSDIGEGFVARAFQFGMVDRLRPLMIAEALIRDELQFVELALQNPYFPVLFVFSSPKGQILEAALLPFPSLCRGGVHFGEFRAEVQGDDEMSEFVRISRERLAELVSGGPTKTGFAVGPIGVDMREAIGSERIFSTALREWLAVVMAVRARPDGNPDAGKGNARAYLDQSLGSPSPRFETRIKSRTNAATHSLGLPADAVPTIAVLTSRKIADQKDSRQAGSFIVADDLGGGPNCLVSLPPSGDSLLSLQPPAFSRRFPLLRRLNNPDPGTDGSSKPLTAVAIRFPIKVGRNIQQLVLPVAPEIDLLPETMRSKCSITVVVSMSCTTRRAATLAQSLILHGDNYVFLMRAVVDRSGAYAREEADELRSLFGEDSVVECDGVENFAEHETRLAMDATTELLLFADETLVLHDRRALGVIIRLAKHKMVASAGCMIISNGPGEDAKCVSAGLVPLERRMRSEISFSFSETDLEGIFSPSVYPVAANASALVVVRTKVFVRLGGFKVEGVPLQDAKIAYAIEAAKAGFVNLCTSLVSAAVKEDQKQHVTTVLTPKLVGELRSSSTMLRIL